MCGEVVSKYLKKDFPQMDMSNFITNNIDKFTEYWGDEIKIQSRLTGYVLDRPKFLLHLIDEFKNMGGNLLIDKLNHFEEKEKKIKLKIEHSGTISTKFLIIASGPKKPECNISDITRNVYSTLLYQVLVKNYPLEKNCVEFYYDERYKENYKWIFPYRDFVKIGVPFENKDELKKYNNYEIIRKDIKPVCCGILKNYNFNNILVVGDAAYQNNPLTKGGIRNAINAGRMAAEAIMKYNDSSKYDRMWKESGFFTEPYLIASKKLRTMKNIELIHQSKPLQHYPFSLPLILLKYRKYIPLYKLYNASRKYGW